MIDTFIFSIIALLLIGFMIYAVITQPEQPRNIAVYSGSFNPIHIGHKAVIDYLSNNFDGTYVIVTPQNPLKENISVSAKERADNISLALFKHEYYNVTINDIENTMLPPYYTIKTLRELKKKEPKNNFELVIGADNLKDIRSWKSYDEILLNFGVIVFPRGNIDLEELEIIKNNLMNENSNFKIKIANVKTPNISSTEIREAQKNGTNVDYLLM